MGLDRGADGLPLALSHLRIDSAVGYDLHPALGEQYVDQHAVVLLGIPDALEGEHLARALTRRHSAPQLTGRELGLDHETDLPAVGLLGFGDRARDAVHRGIGKSP